MKIVLVLLASYLVVEILTGFYTGSLALIADAGHMLADTFGICIALIAAIYSKKEATPVHTFGFFRTEILASFLNSIILSLLSIIIIYEAYRRIFEPLEIQSLPMIIVAIVGLIINIIGMYVLRGEYFHTHNNEDEVTQNKKHTNKQVIETEDLNIQGAKLELLSDTIGSVGVISGGILIAITSINVIDPILSIGLSLFILPRIFNLLKKSVHILMEGVPSNISYELIQQELLKIKGVTGVFDLHIWSITSGLHALSAHVVVMDTSNSYQILDEINSLLEKKFNITHSTIQIERFHPIDNNE
ncbi:cation diffusion facilitator family transporter [Candidatus Nitrosocosmicus franklandus]|uniref:cation diffusion facilitator family transporter n=1 Tax=Candidatus Nitrosocosmicus franklandianus TaxID=1798806 RepID=UPI001558C6BA|nr:cation diffusion facilitator family transporter [Candidatus Nitrosocosmicus franklandus]